jgi:hypothetical protein
MSAPSTQPDGEKLAELRSRVDEYFFSRNTLDSLNSLYDTRDRLHGKIRQLAEVFVGNLVSVITTASSTWVFAQRTAAAATYYGFLGVDLGIGMDVAEAHDRVGRKLREERWKEGFRNAAENLAMHNLAAFLEDEIGRNCATNVLLQCAVLTWSAFEILTTDLFAALLNQNPTMTATLFADEHARKLYSPKDIALSLEEHSYDLSKNMGDVLLGLCRMDDLVKIRTIYAALLKNETIREQLNGVELWRFFKSRNLIVHRAGVVDELFRRSTGIDVKVGQTLQIRPVELEQYILLVGQAGGELLRGAAPFFPAAEGDATA